MGRLFDVVGRRWMIGLSYGASGVVLAVTAFLFNGGALSAFSQTALWTVAFFFASAGASAAYLTVSEVFPLEIRAMAIAFFYAVATAIGGISGPLLFGYLVGTGKESFVMVGFLIGAGWMLLAAGVEFAIGVDAEQKPLEEIAEPLSAEDSKQDGQDGRGQGARPERAVWRPDSQRRLWSPRPTLYSLPSHEDRDIAREVDLLERAAANGPVSERELFKRARARFWGPGRARRALRRAVAQGKLVQSGHSYIAAKS
jgi:MFS family permease